MFGKFPDILSPLPFFLAVVSLSVLSWKLYSKQRRKLPFPPGPKPLPFIGNILDIPKEYEWITYHQWSQIYGDVLSVKAFGLHIVVLNSARAAADLFERRSTLYSDRKIRVMVNNLMGFDWTFAVNGYGDKWRKRRRAFHGQMHQGIAPIYQGVQMREARVFHKQLLDDTDDIPGLARRLLGATVMNMIYGIEITGKDDPYVTIAEEVGQYFSLAVLPGSFMVDYIPSLRYIPKWFPGAGFHRVADRSRRASEEMREKPVTAVKRAMADGTVKPSVVSRMLERLPPDCSDPEQEQLIRDTAGNAYQGAYPFTPSPIPAFYFYARYAAGSDTTVSSVTTFFLAMARYPSVLERAQRELDAVVGNDRLPSFEDRPHLPYVNAIISELLRWQPVTPMALPHSVTADDEYNGYMIPKGSVVIGNVWAMTRDPVDYPEPEEFQPERFLKIQDGEYVRNTAVRDPVTIAFGFGRRICPGRHIAEQSIYAVVALVLATYNITPSLDEKGKPIHPEVKMKPGLVSHAEPFKCTIKPRSARALELIQSPLPDRGL